MKLNKRLNLLTVGAFLLLALVCPRAGNDVAAGSVGEGLTDEGIGPPVAATKLCGSTALPRVDTSSSCLPHYGQPQFILTVNDTSSSEYEPFVTSGDFNGDGLDDVVITKMTFQTFETYELDILINDGNGSLMLRTSSVFLGTPPAVQHPAQVVIADFNGDGVSDIFVADSGYDDYPQPGYQNQLALSAADGKLVDATGNLPQRDTMTHSACAADVDADKDIDLYVGNFWGQNDVDPQILLNDGSGQFSVGGGRLPPLVDLNQNGYTTCEFVDVNNDDAPDLVLGDAGDDISNEHSTPDSEVLLNDGTGVFTLLSNAMPPKDFAASDIAHDIQPVDLDGDDYLDLFVVYERQPSQGSYIQALVNNQDGTFRNETASRLEALDRQVWIRALLLRDLDRDGDSDLLAKPWDESPDPLLFLDDGNGVFSRQPFDFGLGWSLYYAFLDLDGDGGHDLVFATCAPPEDIYAIRDLGCPVFLPLTLKNSHAPQPAVTLTPTPTSTATATLTATPTQPVEPVIVHLAQGDAWVPAGTPIILITRWVVDQPGLVDDYLASLDLTVTLDGETLPGVIDYWGEVEEYGDFDGDGDTDYVSNWEYSVGALSVGTHQVESEFHLRWPITGGFDLDEDGVPDEYSGSWEYFLEMTVGSGHTPTPTPTPTVTPTPTPTPTPSQAELIFHNGTVLTMEGESWDAEAIAVRGDRILAVGSEAEVLSTQGPETEMIDLGGRTLLPGFVDAHTHILNFPWEWGTDRDNTQQLALRNGITTLAEMAVESWFVEEMEQFERDGKLIIRTSLYLISVDACGQIMGDWYTEYPPTREFGEKLRIGGVKIFSDGGTCGDPAISIEYPPWRGGGYGDLWLSETELSQVIAEAHNAGYQVAIHAWGDRAAATVLDAYASALNGQPNTLRHRVEHNTLVRPESRPLYGQIGLIPSFMGFSPTCRILRGEGWPAYYGPGRVSWIYNYRAILDENPGLHATWHGDDPFLGPVSSLIELYGLVTRKEIADDGAICEPPDWLEATALTVEEALRLMTIDAAYALFREGEVGSLKPGKLADLIILSDDPASIDPDDIKDVEVLMTMIGGLVEHCETGHEALCPGYDPPPCDHTFDDFNDPGSGWAVFDDGGRSVAYVGGEYQILLRVPDTGLLVTPDLLLPDEYQIEVDARQITDESASYGLGFGLGWGESTYEGYQFRIDSTTQQYLLEKREMDGTWTTLLDWTYSSAIQQGTASNHLRVSREGEGLGLCVNGAQVATYHETSFLGSGRDAGVRVYSQDAAPVDVRFDNFRVSCAP
jgi:predicted amidohydrolase YtcJ